MKITSLVASGILEFNDLGTQIKGVSPQIRDIKLNPGQSKYLLETSEVLLSAQSGDIRRFLTAVKISVNDSLSLGNGDALVINHNFGIVPNVTVIKNPTTAPETVSAGATLTVTHNTAYTTTTVTNVSLGTLRFDVRVG